MVHVYWASLLARTGYNKKTGSSTMLPQKKTPTARAVAAKSKDDDAWLERYTRLKASGVAARRNLEMLEE